MARAINLLAFFLMPSVYATLNNSCRIIQFNPVAVDKILKNHVIRNISVQSRSQCQSNCFQEPNCVSYNYGPLQSDTPTCELSNRTHLQVSSSNFVLKGKYLYQNIVNYCESGPCPSNTLCQAGFTNKGYRCVCVDGLKHGANCDQGSSAVSAILSSSSSLSSSLSSSSSSSSSSSPSLLPSSSSLSSSSSSTPSPRSSTSTSTFLSSSSSPSPFSPSPDTTSWSSPSPSPSPSPSLTPPSSSAGILPDPTPPACPQGWYSFQSSCYQLTTDPKIWTSAVLKCSSSDAQLVRIDSSEENEFIKATFLVHEVDYWIGLTDEDTEGEWKWSDGSLLTGFEGWIEDQPSDRDHVQNCAGIRKRNEGSNYEIGWHDKQCDQLKGYICEK